MVRQAILVNLEPIGAIANHLGDACGSRDRDRRVAVDGRASRKRAQGDQAARTILDDINASGDGAWQADTGRAGARYDQHAIRSAEAD